MEKIVNNLELEPLTFPAYINWEITRACNFQCIHCYNNSGKKLTNELSHEEKLRVAKQLVDAKVFSVCLSGGEPILCESFWDISRILKDGKIQSNTITHGYFINEKTASIYATFFENIHLSIHGANSKTHDKITGVAGSWKKAANACKLLKDNNAKIRVSTSLLSYNLKEISDIIDLSYKVGAHGWRGSCAIWIGRAALNYPTINITKKQYNDLEKEISKKKKEYGKALTIEYTFDPLQNSIIDEFKKKIPTLCCISPVGICSLFSFLPFSGGSLRDIKLEKAWEKLMQIYKNPNFFELLNSFKKNENFLKMKKIPYLEGEYFE